MVAFSEAIVVGVVVAPPCAVCACAQACFSRSAALSRLEGQGEAQVLLGVLVAEVDAGVVGQHGELGERADHHRGVALEEAAAAAGEQRVAGEDGAGRAAK